MDERKQFEKCLALADEIVSRYRAVAPTGCDPQNTWVATAVSAGTAIYGAVSANKAKKQAQKDAKAQQEAQANLLSGAQGALQGLYEEQQDPVEIFKGILLATPGLLEQILPQLRDQSKATAEDFTGSNLKTRQMALDAIAPDFGRFQKSQVRFIDEMNPDNLGQEELKAITRKLSPLIPEGVLNPDSGAVQGTAPSSVSLYRNLISSAYQERRGQYLNQVGSFLNTAENSAARQQEKASSFLPTFLNLGFGAANNLTGQTLQQDQNNINAQQGYLNTLLSLPTANFNGSQYDQAIAQAVSTGVGALASGYSGYQANKKKTQNPVGAPSDGYGNTELHSYLNS